MKQFRRLYEHDFTALETEVIAHPLRFRRKARQAFEGVNRQRRRALRRLATHTVHPLDFFTAWEALRDDFDTMHRAHTVKTLVNGLEKHLVLEVGEGESLVIQLAHRQREHRITKALETLYHSTNRRALHTARGILSQDDSDIAAFRDAYVTYSLYKAVATSQSMVVYDAQRSLLVRLAQRLQEAAQVRRFKRKTRRALDKISRHIRSLEVQDEGMLASLFALNINLVSIRAAHRRYEKGLSGLKDDDRQASRRLALYEKEVADVKASHLSGMPANDKLRDIQETTKELDSVLLRIFDMDSRSYNELMSRMKHYRVQVRQQDILTRQLHD